MASTGYEGKVLVAHPNLESPFFKKSVIFIYEDIQGKGAQGIILNKPSRFPVKQIFHSNGYEVDLLSRSAKVNLNKDFIKQVKSIDKLRMEIK